MSELGELVTADLRKAWPSGSENVLALNLLEPVRRRRDVSSSKVKLLGIQSCQQVVHGNHHNGRRVLLACLSHSKAGKLQRVRIEPQQPVCVFTNKLTEAPLADSKTPRFEGDDQSSLRFA